MAEKWMTQNKNIVIDDVTFVFRHLFAGGSERSANDTENVIGCVFVIHVGTRRIILLV